MISIAKAHTLGDRWDKYLRNKGVDLNSTISLQKISLNLPSFTAIKEFVKDRKLTIAVHGQTTSLDVSVFDTFNNLLNVYNVEHSYGGRTKQDESKEAKELFGNDNILKLGLDPKHTHISLLVYTPGNGTPMHFDGLHDGEHRFLTAASPWDWGHMLQMDNTFYPKWKSGDLYEIPMLIHHLSTNAGMSLKLSMSLTGVIKD